MVYLIYMELPDRLSVYHKMIIKCSRTILRPPDLSRFGQVLIIVCFGKLPSFIFVIYIIYFIYIYENDVIDNYCSS